LGTTSSIAAAIVVGACLSLQPPVNAFMARMLQSPLLAASISIAISLVFVVLVWLVGSRGAGDLAQVRTFPWWVAVGGIVGVVFVVGGIVVAPALGVALFFVCVIAGQLLGSILLDQLGAFGMPAKPVNPMKLLGLVLVLAGVALVQRSDV
jgi:bacterial/archaeal transporter family-2 protein